jgi:hypothetical protein
MGPLHQPERPLGASHLDGLEKRGFRLIDQGRRRGQEGCPAEAVQLGLVEARPCGFGLGQRLSDSRQRVVEQPGP